MKKSVKLLRYDGATLSLYPQDLSYDNSKLQLLYSHNEGFGMMKEEC